MMIDKESFPHVAQNRRRSLSQEHISTYIGMIILALVVTALGSL
jgi:hypothetical protein